MDIYEALIENKMRSAELISRVGEEMMVYGEAYRRKKDYAPRSVLQMHVFVELFLHRAGRIENLKTVCCHLMDLGLDVLNSEKDNGVLKKCDEMDIAGSYFEKKIIYDHLARPRAEILNEYGVSEDVFTWMVDTALSVCFESVM